MFRILLLVILFPLTAFSQSESLSIDLSQNAPEPYQSITATLNDYAFLGNVTKIVWSINGTPSASALNQRSISFVLEGPDQINAIGAQITTSDGRVLKIERKIKANYIDLIIEPQTRVPSFYQGRALASPGGPVRATVFTSQNPNDLLYTWYADDNLMFNGAVRSKNSAVFYSNVFRKDLTIKVIVTDIKGNTLGEKSITIKLVSPKVLFYEISPLYGQQTKALLNSHQMTDGSIALKAEPYYLDLQTYNSPSELSWSVAGEEVAGTAENPYELILTKEGSGSAGVKFSVRNLELLLQGAERQITINY